jgi:hypothetical protein
MDIGVAGMDSACMPLPARISDEETVGRLAAASHVMVDLEALFRLLQSIPREIERREREREREN